MHTELASAQAAGSHQRVVLTPLMLNQVREAH
jgi:hypothetical protein